MKLIALFLSLMLLFGGISAKAQTTILDSLLQIVPTTKVDTNVALLYIDIGEQYRTVGNLESASEYYLNALALSRNLNYLHGIYYASDYFSFVLYWQGLNDSAIVVNKETMELALKHGDHYQVASEKWNIGVGYASKGLYETALSYYLEALEWYEQAGYREKIGQLYNQILIVYARMERYQEAISYGEKALALQDDTLSISYGYTLLRMTDVYSKSQPPQNEKSMAYLQKVLQITSLTENAVLEAEAYTNMAYIHFQRNEISESETYYHKALAFFDKDNYPSNFCKANIGLATIAMSRNDFKQAEVRAQNNIMIARRHEIRLEERKALLLLWELAVARHDFEGRNRYKAAADSIQNVVVNETMLRAVEELQVKYETEKKELKITALEKEKLVYIWRSIGGVAVLVLLLLFFISRHRLAVSKRKLAEQQVKQLEQEKQLVATQAVLDGETAERTRLARDLHDGLGGMLSVVKLNLYDIKKGVTLEREKVVRFDQTMGMLEKSISELRRVAHNMMPESLSRSGLSEALTDFCKEIPIAEFHYYGSGERLDQRLETVVYRTAIELVNNALKHAHAESIVVQIVQEPDRLALTVQDDGCGFDTTTQSSGAGLVNIRNRVTTFNGRMDLWSQPGEGTDISIEFNLHYS